MSLAAAEQPRIVHALPGRVRVHLPGWGGRSQRPLEAALRRMRGVSDVRSSLLTRNVLIRFDPEATDDESAAGAGVGRRGRRGRGGAGGPTHATRAARSRRAGAHRGAGYGPGP